MATCSPMTAKARSCRWEPDAGEKVQPLRGRVPRETAAFSYRFSLGYYYRAGGCTVVVPFMKVGDALRW